MKSETKLEIKIIGEEVLQKKAENVTDFNSELKQIVKEMNEVMENNKGIGLAAPQVGISKKFFIIDIEKTGNSLIFLANPEIMYKSADLEIMEEGCLSVPGVYADVERPHSIIMRGQDLNGNTVEITASGLLARALMHENDHLNGVLFVDLIDETGLKKIKNQLKKLSKKRK